MVKFILLVTANLETCLWPQTRPSGRMYISACPQRVQCGCVLDMLTIHNKCSIIHVQNIPNIWYATCSNGENIQTVGPKQWRSDSSSPKSITTLGKYNLEYNIQSTLCLLCFWKSYFCFMKKTFRHTHILCLLVTIYQFVIRAWGCVYFTFRLKRDTHTLSACVCMCVTIAGCDEVDYSRKFPLFFP